MASPRATTFLACMNCRDLVEVRDIDDAVEDSTAAMDDLRAIRDFLDRHARHPIAQLVRTPSDPASDRPCWDPMARSQFELTDGLTTFVATRERASIQVPPSLRFTPGTLSDEGDELTVDFRDLRRGIALELGGEDLLPDQVDHLIGIVRDRVAQLDTAELTIAFDTDDEPNVSMAPLPSAAVDSIIEASAHLFAPEARPRISRFLRDHSRADGLLALRVRRHLVTRHAA